MSFPNRVNDSRTLMPIGMLCLVFAILFPYLVHPTTPFGQNLLHGVRGFLMGISIVLNIFAARQAARRRRCDAS